MLQEFVDLWYNSKQDIKDQLAQLIIQDNDIDYQKLLVLMLKEFNKRIENESRQYLIEEVKLIDYGDFQGTLILTFPYNTYQPTILETFYTYVEYGSCTVCDPLQHILYDIEDEAKRVNDLLTLCLHMVQHIHNFKEEE